MPLWPALFVLGGFALACLIVHYLGKVGRNYDKFFTLSPNAAVIEHRRTTWGLITGFEGTYLPIPHYWDGVVGKDLILGSQWIDYGEYSKFHPSPDGKKILVEPGQDEMPWEILEVQSARKIEVNEPDDAPANFDNAYAFQFVRWKNDSQNVVAAITGTYYEQTGSETMSAYRELWEIDASTGLAKRFHRATQLLSGPSARVDPSTDPP